MDLGQLFALLKHDAMAIASYRLNASSYYASATDSSFSALDMTSRNYPPAGYSGSNSSPPHNSYSSSYEQSSGRPYYPATSSARVGHQPQPTQYYTPIAPAPPSDRYSTNNSYRPSTEYSSPSAYPASQYADNRGPGYQSNAPGSGSYPYNAPRAISPLNAPASYHRTHQPRPFIPTPSEAYANPGRPPRPSSAMHHGSGSYSSPPHALPPPSRPSGSGSGSSRPRGTAPPPVSTGSGERFICEVCGKDFSRAHDRKRHYETQHAATPITHKCIHCEKDFSRADSLKRHLQNGCDEAPQ